MIVIKDLVKKYNDNVKIGPLNFEIHQNGITSIIGPNGAGKSTMALMVGRLLDKSKGSVTINGLDIDMTSSDELAKVISTLRQENHFTTRLTVRQLVSFGRYPYSKGRITDEDEAIISKYIDFFELTDLENRYLTELSGGQRQRAYVAMVLCQETEYVILDEPLNNLDVSKSVQMMQYLKQACQVFKKTIIIVLHDINFASRYSDNICLMKNGQLVALGKPNEVLQSKLLSDVFETPIEIVTTEFGKFALY